MHANNPSDRSALIRLASTMPVGDETRRSILSNLKRVAMEFDTQEALDKYLKEHPGADKSKHRVKKDDPKDSAPKGDDRTNEHKLTESFIAAFDPELHDTIGKAPAESQRFVYDSAYRNKVMSDAGNALRTGGEKVSKIAKRVFRDLKGKTKNIKSAVEAVLDAKTPSQKDMDALSGAIKLASGTVAYAVAHESPVRAGAELLGARFLGHIADRIERAAHKEIRTLYEAGKTISDLIFYTYTGTKTAAKPDPAEAFVAYLTTKAGEAMAEGVTDEDLVSAMRKGKGGKTKKSSDRSALIRLAATLPSGSGERRSILAGLVAGTAPTNVLQALVRGPTEDLGDARRRYDLLEEDYGQVGLGGVRLLLDRWAIHGQDRMSVLHHFMDPLTRRAGLPRMATLLPVYREDDYIDAAYRAAELYPGDPTKVFAILGAALNVKPNGAFDPAELGDVLTTYNFHRERATIEPLIQAGNPIPYRQIVGRSPFITTRGLSRNQPENEKWRYDNANQTLPVPQVLRALAEFVGLKPGQMILTGDLIRYLMEYVNVSVRNISRLGIARFGPVTMHRDMVR